MFSLPSPSSLLKLPNIKEIGPTFVFAISLLCFLSIGPGMEQLCGIFLKKRD